MTSPQLSAQKTEEYRNRVLSAQDRMDSTIIWLMHDWIFNPLAEEYGLSADWDDRWRTGGTLEEVIDEAHLSPQYLLAGIERFVQDRTIRLQRLRGRVGVAIPRLNSILKHESACPEFGQAGVLGESD